MIEWETSVLIYSNLIKDCLLALSVESLCVANVSTNRLLVAYQIFERVISSRSLNADWIGCAEISFWGPLEDRFVPVCMVYDSGLSQKILI